ncbi:nuclear RNase Z [Dunaliella salina]|uniref:Nuclear RNase Z n=1 Tax=Dunaliella salina TaxID=3046 RepID=A0ABQ7G6I2_DUNSA|nr:nuclear RNase Z [Dunaliella salina]|eukprot:KAF5830223.1 nuclear RNase Z [Dunaliella salina]
MFDKLKSLGVLGDAKPATPAEAAQPQLAYAQAHTIPDSRAQKLSVAGFELEGCSIAGQETCIIVPRAKVVFDIGRCPQRAVFQQTVLISHGHLDHVGGLPFHVSSRGLNSLPPSKIVLPPSYTEGDDELQLPSGFTVKPLATTHGIESQGYVLYSLRKKLKAELQGRGQEDIKQLRLGGMDVQETIKVPEIAFTADTTVEFLERDSPALADALRARLLIIEMTFVDDTVSVDEARERGHLHIADFIVHAHRFQNEAILLIHFSARYKRSEIINALNTNLPPSLRAKCVPFLNGYAD